VFRRTIFVRRTWRLGCLSTWTRGMPTEVFGSEAVGNWDVYFTKVGGGEGYGLFGEEFGSFLDFIRAYLLKSSAVGEY